MAPGGNRGVSSIVFFQCFIPEHMKDNKYWAKRRRNNEAAQISREAKRRKENQIIMRASFLEVENSSLKKDVQKIRESNDVIREDLKGLTRRLRVHQGKTV